MGSSKKNKDEVLQVSLDEVMSKLDSMGNAEAEVSATGEVVTTVKARRRRTKALENASVLIVHANLDENMSALDLAISSCIDHDQVGSTVLAGVRSIDEVKRARKLISLAQTRKFSNRRLEEGDDDANADYSGVYYVSMTPNIFAGLLYMFLFTFVTYLGFGCMNLIQGQDVYVDKMPSIGREA